MMYNTNNLEPLVEPIDFETFKSGNIYPIKVIRSGTVYRYHRIGDFRKGIAIAKGPSFDCLININCEVIFQPRSIFGFWGSESTQPRIIRELGGNYIIMAYKDVSSPGKDADYQGPYEEEKLDEYGNFISFRKETDKSHSYNQILKEQLIDYPSGIPFEKGKVVKYGRTYYDLETMQKLKNKA